MDVLLFLYQQVMRTTRAELNDKYAHLISKLQIGPQPDLNWENILFSARDFISNKTEKDFMSMPGAVSVGRALLHGYLSGNNSNCVDLPGFQKGCAKFGIDYPIPSINMRLGMYGNTDEVISLLRKTAPKDTDRFTDNH